MYFTKEDYLKIEKWLQSRAVRDIDLPSTTTVEGKDFIPIIQDSKNKIISVNDLLQNNVTVTNNSNVVALHPTMTIDVENAVGFNVDSRELWEIHDEEGDTIYNRIFPITTTDAILHNNELLKNVLDSRDYSSTITELQNTQEELISKTKTLFNYLEVNYTEQDPEFTITIPETLRQLDTNISDLTDDYEDFKKDYQDTFQKLSDLQDNVTGFLNEDFPEYAQSLSEFQDGITTEINNLTKTVLLPDILLGENAHDKPGYNRKIKITKPGFYIIEKKDDDNSDDWIFTDSYPIRKYKYSELNKGFNVVFLSGNSSEYWYYKSNISVYSTRYSSLLEIAESINNLELNYNDLSTFTREINAHIQQLLDTTDDIVENYVSDLMIEEDAATLYNNIVTEITELYNLQFTQNPLIDNIE